jgi:hypothetical protein
LAGNFVRPGTSDKKDGDTDSSKMTDNSDTQALQFNFPRTVFDGVDYGHLAGSSKITTDVFEISQHMEDDSVIPVKASKEKKAQKDLNENMEPQLTEKSGLQSNVVTPEIDKRNCSTNKLEKTHDKLPVNSTNEDDSKLERKNVKGHNKLMKLLISWNIPEPVLKVIKGRNFISKYQQYNKS